MNDEYRDYSHFLYAGKKAPGTIEQRLGDLKRFQTSTKIAPNDATAQQLLSYMASGYARWSPSYSKRIRGTLRSFYQWRVAEGLATTDPSSKLPPIKVPKRRARRPAPDDQVLAAFEAGTLVEQAIVTLAASMGLRRQEIAGLPLDAREGRELRVLGKGGHERTLPLDDESYRVLLALEAQALPGERYYLPGRFPGTHLHHHTVYEYIKRLMPKQFPHSLRYRAATVGFRETKDIRATQEFLGHASLATTEIYVESDRRDVAALTRATSIARIRQPTQAQLSGLDALLAAAAAIGTELEPHGWTINIIKSSAVTPNATVGSQ
ncbi:tyrosine-type recombinase/integrase [Pseudoclavibacter sp. AY1F1]|uniref:tyrosine-type recombinase/integrase n=1 Tax=Pseudoclavibacter sp. AY1F1 TaxID=2080583 RepID=UPI0015E2B2A5|nr:tyrosine-type recombinase/integrase [Pseudoclavibacter sp. AY1F1]